MRIDVIVPVVNAGLYEKLMDSIAHNSVKPHNMIIINNSQSLIKDPKQFGINAKVFNMEQNIGVNPAWNFGISQTKKADIVSILNDDLELAPNFFERICYIMDEYPKCGIVCPCTVNSKDEVVPKVYQSVIVALDREGWAFSIRRKMLDMIPPIPADIKIFYGDNWFWYWTLKLGYVWLKDYDTMVLHHVGVSVKKILNNDKTKLKQMERRLFKTHITKWELRKRNGKQRLEEAK